MSNDFSNYVRKQFTVSAVRVTPMNIDRLARECDGRIMEGDKEGNFSRKFIKVRVAFANSERQTEAHIGDWLVRNGRDWKVYTDKAFRKTFEHKDGTPVEAAQMPAKQRPTPAQMPKKRTDAEPVEVVGPNDPGTVASMHPTSKDLDLNEAYVGYVMRKREREDLRGL